MRKTVGKNLHPNENITGSIKYENKGIDQLIDQMKKLSSILLIMILISCNNTQIDERDDIIDTHGTISNVERLDEFIKNIKDRKKDRIRITRHTVEGDPIYYYFTFDGIEVKYKYDNSKDKFGTSIVRSTVCKNFTKNKAETGIEYKLEGCSGENADMGNSFSFTSSSQEIVLPNEPLEPIIIFNETEVPFLFGSYCWFGMNKEQGVCSDPPHPDTFNKNIRDKAIVVQSGGGVRISFPIVPDEVSVVLKSSEGKLTEVELSEGIFSLPEEKGYYHYVLSAIWNENNTVSYHFGLYVQ
jgi:hypothetical protein